MQMGIRGKLVTMLMLAGLLPLVLALAVGVYGVQQARTRFAGQAFRAMASEHAQHISTLLSSQIEFFLVINHLPGTVQFLRNAGQVPFSLQEANRLDQVWPTLTENDEPLKQILGNEIAKRWQAIEQEQPRTAEALMTDRWGRLVAAATKTTDYYQADEDWWQECWADGRGKTVVSEPVFDETAISASGKPGATVVNVCLPIYDQIANAREPELIGIIKLAMEVGWLASEVQGHLPGMSDSLGTEVWLITGNGQPIRESNQGDQRVAADVLAQVRSRLSGYTISKTMNDRELVGFSRIVFTDGAIKAPTDWAVLVMGKRSLATASTRFMIWTTVIVGIGVIAASLIGGWWLARLHVIRPLLQLQQGTTELERGHLDYRLLPPGAQGTVFHHDEIGAVANDFNQMASQLERSVDAMAKANRLKEQFIDLASHELRTPITYLLGVTQLAQRQNGADPGLLDRIRIKAQRLSRIVDNMFKLLKSGMFEETMTVRQVDLVELAHAAAGEIEPFLKSRNQLLAMKTDPDVGTINADGEKLRDILGNLLTNAIRFSPDGATIQLELIAMPDRVQIAVSNSGPGISPEDLPHIFEPFYRGQKALACHSSGESEYMSAGIGLGLCVVKRLTELHGGDVAVESDDTITRFRVTLPRQAATRFQG